MSSSQRSYLSWLKRLRDLRGRPVQVTPMHSGSWESSPRERSRGVGASRKKKGWAVGVGGAGVGAGEIGRAHV